MQNQGAGLVAGEHVQSFLRKYDRTQRAVVIPCKFSQYLDSNGDEVHRQPTPMKMTSWDLLYYLLRAIFDGVKSPYCDVPSALPGDGTASYEYGHTVKNIRDCEDGKVEVDFVDKDGNNSTEVVDQVIAADGASSTLRKILLPEVQRHYVGYVAWRGTVPENELSKETYDTLVEKGTYFHTRGIQILAYTIPGKHGTLDVGKRLMNWVWYCNYEKDSTEFRELMTDCDGHQHQITMPTGKIKPQIWEAQKRYARQILSPQMAEVVGKTKQPFVQAITDVFSPRISFYDGKVLLLGDAVAGFRPHTGSSTNQAAFDAEKLSELMRGAIDKDQWTQEVMEFAKKVQQAGIEMGERSQFGNHPWAIQKSDANPVLSKLHMNQSTLVRG